MYRKKGTNKVLASINQWILIVFGLIFGIYLVGLFGYNGYKYLDSFRWEETTGTIIHSEAEVLDSQAGAGSKNSKIKLDSDQLLSKIEYKYSVDGDEYKSDNQFRFFMLESSANRKLIDEDSSKYPEGKVMTVFYNESKPEESIIDRSVNVYDFVIFVFSFIVGLFSVVFSSVWVFFRFRPDKLPKFKNRLEKFYKTELYRKMLFGFVIIFSLIMIFLSYEFSLVFALVGLVFLGIGIKGYFYKY